MNWQIGVGDSKYVIVFDPYSQITWFGARADIALAFKQGRALFWQITQFTFMAVAK